MPKQGMMAIRKEAIVEATISEIGRVGTLDVTVSQIAKKAGISSGLAHHYLGTKDDIFIAAMRHILTTYGNEVRHALAEAKTPMERAKAIVNASFSEANFRKEVVGAWLNFYVQANASAPTRRLLKIYHARLLSNLTSALRQIIGPAARDTATGIAAMIDGFYIQLALNHDLSGKDRSLQLIMDYLDMSIRENTSAETTDGT